MKAKRIMALVMCAMLEISSLGSAYMPVFAAGESEVSVVDEDALSEDALSEDAVSEDVVSEDVDEQGEPSSEAVEEEDVSAGVDISSYLTVDDKGTITKYSYEGEEITDIIIPSTVNGISVKGINDGVFKGHKEIISVQFPSTLEWIGNSAFENASLGSSRKDGHLVIPANVTQIGYNAFKGCNALGIVTFEEGNTPVKFITSWGKGNTFTSCAALTTIELSNRIDILPGYFANDCQLLSDVKWSSTVTEIGDNAFENDVVLDSTDLSGTVVTTIGNYAFSGCTGFGLVKFPETLVTIGNGAFAKTLMGKRSAAGQLVIPASVSDIGYNAFESCIYLESVTFNDQTGADVTAINFGSSWGKGETFAGCEALKTMTLSNKTVNLPPTFAHNCPVLSTVNWSKALKKIDEKAFENDPVLNSPDMSNTSLESIETEAFKDCKALQCVKLPETLKIIGGSAFQCTAMGTASAHGDLVIPSAVTHIGYYAFENCEFLGSVTFKPYTGEAALDAMTFGESWGHGQTFANCKVLKSITMSNRLSVIPAEFAMKCESLKTVKWGAFITEIGDSAFYNDIELNSPDFSGTTLKTIGESAFEGCTSFGLAVFPRSLKSIGASAFKGTAMGAEGAGGVLVISEEVSYVGPYAFCNCAYLSGVMVEDYTGDGALPVLTFATSWGHGQNFANCPMLEEIIIGDRVKTIPYEFALDDPSLTMLTIPASVETIEQGAFYVNTEDNKKINTILSTDNQIAKDYDWEKDNRVIASGSKVFVDSVTLNKTELEVGTGKSVTLKATVTPDNATNKKVIWKSDNAAIATVDANGKVTGVAAGETRIIVTTVDGGKTASCTVKVTESGTPGGDGEELTLPGKKNTEVTASLVFITNGADELDQYYTLNKSGKKAKLVNMVKKGYSFKGWYCEYTDKNGNKKPKRLKTLTAAILSKYSVDNTLTLEARFTSNKYTIKYKVTKPAKKVKVSGKIKLSKDEKKIDYATGKLTVKGETLTAKGYTLAGWTTKKGSAEVMLTIGETVTLEELIPEKGKTITLYPVWK